MCREANSRGTNRSTCSPGSAAGPTPCNSPDGKHPSGQVLAPVSPSAPPGSARPKRTSATCGPLFSGSSPSAGPRLSLASRLAASLGGNGSPEYTLTWTRSAIEYHGTSRRITSSTTFRLRASGRRTSGSGCTGWRTPQQGNADQGPKSLEHYQRCRRTCESQITLTDQARLAGWPTPMAGTPAQKGYNEAGNTDSGRKTMELVSGWPTPKTPTGGGFTGERKPGAKGGRFHKTEDVALLAGWPTPGAAEGGSTSRSGDRKDEPLIGGLVRGLAGWATPTHGDAQKIKPFPDAPQPALAYQCQTAGYPTPSARDWRDGRSNQHDKNARPLNEVATNAFGETLGSSPAETARPGAYRLNPRFSLWLMGYPDEWACCGERAMRSVRKSRRSS